MSDPMEQRGYENKPEFSTRDYGWLVALSVLLLVLPMMMLMVRATPDIAENGFIMVVMSTLLLGAGLCAGVYLLIVARQRIGGGRAARIFIVLTLAGVIALPVGAVLHNVISGVLRTEEPVFFIIAVLVAPALLIGGVIGGVVTALATAFRSGHAA